MLEAQLESKFRDKVRKVLDGKTFKLIATEKGIPDRLVLLPGGRIYLVELKTETGRVSPAQSLWHDKAAQVGVVVHVLYGEADVAAWVADRLAEYTR